MADDADGNGLDAIVRTRYRVRVAITSFENVVEFWVATPLGEYKAVALAALHIAWTRPGARIEWIAITDVETGMATIGEFELSDPWADRA